MLIPAIDLMGGNIVQLIQGREKALEFDDKHEWLRRFESFPLVQLIDLDAALGQGRNRGLVEFFAARLTCQVGGGIRSLAAARATLALGARRVILGSKLVERGEINVDFARKLAAAVGREKLVFSVDARQGKVAIQGWRQLTSISPLEMVRALEDYCGAFLYTHIDSEGLMLGLPLAPVVELRQATGRQLIAAGGIRNREEVDRLDRLGIDAVVGMALYSGHMSLPVTIPLRRQSIDT